MKLQQNLNILLISLSGMGFLIFGTWLLISPLDGLASFGLSLAPEAVHRVEIRAFYGGLEIGLGLLLLKFGFSKAYRRAGLWLVFASYGCLGMARIVGIVAENSGLPPSIWIALAVELGLGGLAVLALIKNQRQALS